MFIAIGLVYVLHFLTKPYKLSPNFVVFQA